MFDQASCKSLHGIVSSSCNTLLTLSTTLWRLREQSGVSVSDSLGRWRREVVSISDGATKRRRSDTAGVDHVTLLAALSAGARLHILEPLELELSLRILWLDLGGNCAVSVQLSVCHADALGALALGTLLIQ